MWDNKEIFTFRYDVWASGHAPTNYKKWRGAKFSYTVTTTKESFGFCEVKYGVLGGVGARF